MQQRIKDLEEKYRRAERDLEEKDLMLETLQLENQYKAINYRELEENYNILEEKLVNAIEDLKNANHIISEISTEPKKVDVALLGKKHPRDLIRNFIKLNQLYYTQNRLYKEQKSQLKNSKKFIRKLTNDKAVLDEKVNQLIKEDINRKVLNFAMDENVKLAQELQITRQRLFTYKETHNLEEHAEENDKETAWETTIDDTTDDETENKDKPTDSTTQPPKDPDNSKKDQTTTPPSAATPNADPTKNTNNNAGKSPDRNGSSVPSDGGGQNPNNFRSRTFTASGRGITTDVTNQTSNSTNGSIPKTNNDYNRRPRSWTGQSHRGNQHSHRTNYDKRKNIPCKFAIRGKCRYSETDCYYYHPKEHQMSYYRGHNWVPNIEQAPKNHQQRETSSNDLLYNIQSLNSLILEQMHRQQQNQLVHNNHQQPYQQNYVTQPDANQTTNYNHPDVTNAYNFQQPIDQNITQPMYDAVNSLTYVNQSNH